MVLTATKARMPLAAMVIVLGAVFGVLLATLRPTRAPAHETAEVPPRQVERVPVPLSMPPDEQVDAPSAAADASPQAEVAPPLAPQSEPRREPEEALAREPRRAPSRPGAVRGRLEPRLEGVVVLAGGAGVLPLDSEAVGWPLEPGGAEPTPVRRGVTDAEGRFRIEGLEPGPLRLLVRTALHARLERDDLWALPDDELDLGDLVLRPAAVCSVTVETSDGARVEGTRLYLVPQALGGPVRALGPAACAPLRGTTLFGEFEATLPFGASTLLAVAPGHPPAWEQVVVEPSDTLAAFAIRLPAAQALRGELIDVDDLGLGGLRVGALSLRAPRVGYEAARAAGVPFEALIAHRTTRADASRRFVLEGLEHDEAVLLRALGDGRMDVPDAFAPEVLAVAGEPRIELYRRAGAALGFTAVEDRTGEPVEPVVATLLSGRDFMFEPDAPPLERWFPGAQALWTDIRPRRAASNPLYVDLPESEDLTLAVRSGSLVGGFDGLLRLRTGERLDLGTIRLSGALPPVHVLVAAATDGARLEGAVCELVPLSGEEREGRAIRAETDRQGHARLLPPAGEPCDLVVRREGFSPRRLALAAAPSSDPLLVALSPGGTLRVHVLDAERKPIRSEVFRRKAGAEVASSLIEAYERALTDAEGAAVFGDLEPGMVAVAARALPRHDLELPADTARMTWVAASVAPGAVTEVEAPAAPTLSLRMTVLADGRPLPYALVRLSADPQAFRDPYAHAATLLRQPTARCDRGGKAAFEGLPPADYALRVEHPDLPGFGRAVVRLEPGSQTQWVEVRSGGVAGWVLDEAEAVLPDARVVAWAYAPMWEEGQRLEPGMSLHGIAPEPVVLGQARKGEDGSFGLTGPPGVQVVLTGIDVQSGSVGDYWIEELPDPEVGEPVALHTRPGARLDARVVVPAGGAARALGVVAVCLDQPWGRGVVARACDGSRLELDHVPQGRWRACAVELASGHLIVALGPWVEVEALPADEPLFLPWP